MKPAEAGAGGAAQAHTPNTTPEEVRPPFIAVPSFVTPEWVRRYVILTRQDVRIFHTEYAEQLRKISGFPWPTQKPDLETTYQLIVEGLRYPFFLPAFDAFYRAPKRAGSRKRSMLSHLYGDIVHASHKFDTDDQSLNMRRYLSPDGVASFIARGGNLDLARAIVVLDWGSDPVLYSDAMKVTIADPDLGPYVAGMAKYKTHANFELTLIQEELSSGEADVGVGEKLFEEGADQVPIDVGSETAEAVKAQWVSDLDRIIEIALASREATPDEHVQADLTEIVNRLGDHVAAYDTTLARTAETAELIDRLHGIVENLELALERVSGHEALGVDKGFSPVFENLPTVVSTESYTKALQNTDRAEIHLSDATQAAAEANLARQNLPMKILAVRLTPLCPSSEFVGQGAA